MSLPLSLLSETSVIEEPGTIGAEKSWADVVISTFPRLAPLGEGAQRMPGSHGHNERDLLGEDRQPFP